MLSKPSTKTEHWTKRASRTLKLFEGFIEHLKLEEEWKHYPSVKTVAVAQSSTSGESDGQAEDDFKDFNDGGGKDDDDFGDDSGDEPEDDGDDDPFESSFNKFITVFVRVHFNQYPTYTFHVKPTWKLRVLDLMMASKMKLPQNMLVFFNMRGDNLYKTMSFVEANIGQNNTVHCRLTLDGGANPRRVISAHLKQDEARVKLLKKSKENIQRYMEQFEVKSESIPASLNNAVQPIKEKMTNIKRAVSQGEDVLERALEALDDGKLDTLAEIFKVRSGKFTEEKLLQSCYAVLPEMSEIDEWIGQLQKLKQDVVIDYMETYASVYVKTKDGQLIYDNDKFLKSVENLIAYRKRLRREASNASERGDDQQQGGQNVRNCCVM